MMERTETLVVRIKPELLAMIEADTKETGRSKSAVVRRILAMHYHGKVGAVR
jgi:negative regulator of replication initiation